MICPDAYLNNTAHPWAQKDRANKSSYSKSKKQYHSAVILPAKKTDVVKLGTHDMLQPDLRDRDPDAEVKPPSTQTISFKQMSTQTNDTSSLASSDLRPLTQKQSTYRPMVTFAPEKMPFSAKSLHQYGGHNHSQDQLRTTWPASTSNDDSLPFHFMPLEDKAVLDVAVKRSSIARLIVTPLTYLGAMFIRFLALALNAFFAPIPNESNMQSIGSKMRSHQSPISVLSTPNIHQKRPTTIRSKRLKSHSLEPPNMNADTEKTSRDSIYVKNPKELLPPVPSGWKSLFRLQPGEWRCQLCNFKNIADTLTCDNCLAIKAGRGRDESGSSIAKETKYSTENSPSAMSCDSSITSLSLNLDDEIDNMFSTNNNVQNNDHDDSTLETGDRKSPQTHQGATNAKAAPKKRSKDLNDDNESNLKRSGIDHGNSTTASIHHQQDIGGTEIFRKRATDMSDDQFNSKRSHVALPDEQNAIEDMDISPNK